MNVDSSRRYGGQLKQDMHLNGSSCKDGYVCQEVAWLIARYAAELACSLVFFDLMPRIRLASGLLAKQ